MSGSPSRPAPDEKGCWPQSDALWSLHKTLIDQCPERYGDFVEVWRIFVEMLVSVVRAEERSLAMKHLERDHPKRVDIDGGCGAFVPPAFRRGVLVGLRVFSWCPCRSSLPHSARYRNRRDTSCRQAEERFRV